LHPPHPLVASRTHAVPVVGTSMATYFYGHPIPRTDRQCTRPGGDAELSGGRSTLVCTHHTRPVASRTHAVPMVWTSMATYFYGHPIPRTDRQCTRRGRDAELLGGRGTLVCTYHTRLSRRGRTPDPWFGLLWPHTSMATQFRARTASARGPVGMRNCWRNAGHWFTPTTPACRAGDARRTRGLTSMATYFYGHPIPRTDRQCTRPGKDAELIAGRPTLILTHHTRLSRRGRTPYPWFDFYGHILLWRPNSAHGPPVHAAR